MVLVGEERIEGTTLDQLIDRRNWRGQVGRKKGRTGYVAHWNYEIHGI